MQILVTGGAGFIGGHIAERLVRVGHDVTALDNLDDYYDTALKRRTVAACDRAASDGSGTYEFVYGDIRDAERVGDLVAQSEVVYHHAAQAGVRANIPAEKYHSVNVDGTFTLLDAAKKHGLRRFVIASSSSVYGSASDLPYSERDATKPVSHYGVSKLAAERYAIVHGEQHGFPVVALRYFTVYGPRMRPNMAISNFTSRAAAGKPPVIYGDGEQTRDFTYVSDVVDVNEQLLHTDAADGRVLNVGSGERIRIGALAHAIRDVVDADVNIRYTEGYDIDADHTQADITTARSLLSYDPKYTIRDGVQAFVDWYRENREWYEPLVLES